MTDAETLIDAVRNYADAMLRFGRDRYGAVETPLLADGVDPAAGEPVALDERDVGAERRLSNFAVQQPFLRALVGLTETTGDGRYRDAAAEVTAFAFDELAGPSGLLHWGGHVAYDLDDDAVATKKGGPHELKFDYPFYEFLWSVDPDATRRFVEAFWAAHVLDWDRLDFNRHGEWGPETAGVWDRDYAGGDVFFWGDGLTFVNTGSDLYYAAGLLSALDGDDAPRRWAERLAERYVETRGETGISGYQFSQHPSWCNGPEVRGDRAQYQFAPYIRGDHRIVEGTLFRPRPVVQRRQLELGAKLGADRFTDWAVEELRAWAEVYRPATNDFEPMLTDGYSLERFVIRREGYFGPKGRVIEPIEADAGFLWTYALAARRTGDETCAEMCRHLAAGLGLRDDSGPRTDHGRSNYRAIQAALERYRATGREGYLDAAASAGENLLAQRFDGTAFVDDDGVASLGDPAPLALLHLAAALGDEEPSLPTQTSGESPAGGV